MDTSTRLVARTPTDLVAAAPTLLGFHPRDSVVLMTFGEPGLSFHARVDLPLDAVGHAEVTEVLMHAVTRNAVRRAALLLYSEDEEVAAAQADRLLVALLDADVEVVDVLRVEEDRWFTVPDDGGGGTPYDLSTHPFTARHVFEGRMVHSDRAALADSLVGTDEDDAVAVALAATRHADDLLARGAAGERPELLRNEARWLQGVVRRLTASRDRATPAEAGRLLVLTAVGAVRDVAWAEIRREDGRAHVELWRDLVRRAPHDLVPGAAGLLAFSAWQLGDGALAWCAVDRCLEVDPDHSMAHALGDLLASAVPPTSWVPIRESELPVLADPARVPTGSSATSPPVTLRDPGVSSARDHLDAEGGLS